MSYLKQTIWQRRNKRITFLSVDSVGRYDVPVLPSLIGLMRLRKQTPSSLVSVTMANFMDSFGTIEFNSVKHMAQSLNKRKWKLVRTMVERPVVEACCYTLMLRNPSKIHDYDDAWEEFSLALRETSDMFFRGTSVLELESRELKGVTLGPPPVYKAPSLLELELEAARKLASSALRRFRNERDKALDDAAQSLSRALIKHEKKAKLDEEAFKNAPEVVEVHDPDLELWTIKES